MGPWQGEPGPCGGPSCQGRAAILCQLWAGPGRRQGPTYAGNAPLPHLLLLPHDLQLLGQLDLALALGLLRRAAQLLPMLLPQRVQGPARIPDLGQFVLQPFVVHWGGERQPQGPLPNPAQHRAGFNPERRQHWNSKPQCWGTPWQRLPVPTAGQRPRTPALIQLVEQLQQLRMHVVDGLEERQDGGVVGDAAAPHVVALHAVDERGDCVLQRLQELLVVLLGLAVLVLLLEEQGSLSAHGAAALGRRTLVFLTPEAAGHRTGPPRTSRTLSGAGCPSPGCTAGSVRDRGADGVGLLRTSSCFFSQ